MKPVDLDLQETNDVDIGEGDANVGPGSITLTNQASSHQEHNHDKNKNKKDTPTGSTSKTLTKSIGATSSKIATNKKRKKFPMLPLSSNRKIRRTGSQRPLLQQDDDLQTTPKDETGDILPQTKNDEDHTTNSNSVTANSASTISSTEKGDISSSISTDASTRGVLNSIETGSKTTNGNTPIQQPEEEENRSCSSSTCSEVSSSSNIKKDSAKKDPPGHKHGDKEEEDLGQLCEKFHFSGIALEPGMNRLDIICGRGNGVQAYPGNIYFRSLVKKYKESYTDAKRTKEKRLIIKNIIARVSMVGGRFMKANRTGNSNGKSRFVVLSSAEAEVKTAQALRDTINRSRIATGANSARKVSKKNIATTHVSDIMSNLIQKKAASKADDPNNTDTKSNVVKKVAANSVKRNGEEKGKKKSGGKGHPQSDDVPAKKKNDTKDNSEGTNISSPSSVANNSTTPDRRPSCLNIVIDEKKRQKIMSIEKEVSQTNDQINILKRQLAKAEESKQMLVQSIFDEIFSSSQPGHSSPKLSNEVPTHSHVNGVENTCQTTSSNQQQDQSNNLRDRATMNWSYMPPNITPWANAPAALSYQQLLNMAKANSNKEKNDITRLNAFLTRDINNAVSSSPIAAVATNTNTFTNNDIANTTRTPTGVMNTYPTSSNTRTATNHCHNNEGISPLVATSSPSTYGTGMSKDLSIINKDILKK